MLLNPDYPDWVGGSVRKPEPLLKLHEPFGTLPSQTRFQKIDGSRQFLGWLGAITSAWGKWQICCLAFGCVGLRKHRRDIRRRALPTTKARTTLDLSPKLQSFLETAGATGASIAPGKGGNVSIEGIARAEAVWKRLRTRALQHSRGEKLDLPPEVVKRRNGNTPVTQKSFDVVVCGGTLGILVARALQNQGFSVCIVERGVVQGRDQEWNVSCEELQPLVRHDIVSQDEVDNRSNPVGPIVG